MIFFVFLLSQFQFEQNKIQYRQHEWLIRETQHFDIYHYKTERVLIPFAEDVLEEAYSRLKERLGYRESKKEEKIPIIIYKSHPDFEETNVIIQRIPESVGGFAEILKKRIVLPFNGSYSDFRHTLFHELVHIFQYRILYGKGTGALQRMSTLQVPLWFIEGMAEFESLGWDESAETYIRDAVINNRLYSIPQLNRIGGYPIYKEGQSILEFIRERYGEEKIGEILNKINVTQTFKGALRAVLGIDERRLNEEWTMSIRKKYWPLIKEKKNIGDIASPIVTHRESHNIYNYAPSISPGDDKILYYTDREGEVQIRFVSSLTGKDLGLLVKGGRSPKFESLHLMDGHLDFSPDGESVVFPAMEKGKDVLYIYDVRKGAVKERLDLPLDRIKWPEWSSDGLRLVFMGLRNGASDIYIYNLEDKTLKNITHDRYSDAYPTWKGDSIIFVSDRPRIEEWDYSKKKLFISDLEGNIREYFSFGDDIISPEVYNSNIYFISYRDGGKNLYLYNPDSGIVKQVTDLVGSLEYFSISPSGKVAVSVYSNIGWDIFLIDSIDELEGKEPNPPMKFRDEYIQVSLDENKEEKKAPLRLGVDYVSGALGYYSDYGLFGYFFLGMSDILGNHQLYALFDNTNLLNSDFYIQYLYLKQRLDYAVSFIRQKNYFLYGDNIIRADLWNLDLGLWYPIDRFKRFEFDISFFKLGGDIWKWNQEDYGWDVSNIESSYGTLGGISLVKDNTIWGYTAPVKGFRGRVTLEKNLIGGKNFWEMGDGRLDLRKYWYLSRDLDLAMRLYFLHSWGRDREQFATVGLGGGRSVRGYPYNYLLGTTAGFLNLEIRLPLIKMLELGLPPISLGRIEGALFTDIGGATYNYEDFRFFKAVNSRVELVDPIMSFGVEMRFNLGVTVLNFDISKRTNLNRISKDTHYDVYLGFPF